MGRMLLAGIGGFIGSILRYSVSGMVQDLSRSIQFPYGTLAVNFIGCLAIGFLSQLAESRGYFTAETRTLVFVGDNFLLDGVHGCPAHSYPKVAFIFEKPRHKIKGQ